MSEGREDGKASVEDASAPAPEAVSPPAVAVQPDSVQPAESDTPTLLPHMEDGQLVATVSEVLVDPSLPFGAHHGPRIDNYETVLREVDEMLTGKPPAIEYLFVCPFRNKGERGIIGAGMSDFISKRGVWIRIRVALRTRCRAVHAAVGTADCDEHCQEQGQPQTGQFYRPDRIFVRNAL